MASTELVAITDMQIKSKFKLMSSSADGPDKFNAIKMVFVVVFPNVTALQPQQLSVRSIVG